MSGDALGPAQRASSFPTNILLLGVRGPDLGHFSKKMAALSTEQDPVTVRTASTFPLPPNPHRQGIDFTVVLVSLGNAESVKLLQAFCAAADVGALCGRCCALVHDADAETTHTIDLEDIRIMAAELRVPLRFCDARVEESAQHACDQSVRLARLAAGKVAGVPPLLPQAADFEFVRSTLLRDAEV